MMMFRNSAYGIGRCFSGLGMGAWGPWGMLIGLGITILVVSLVIILFQRNRRSNTNEHLLDVLKERYVNGEITEEEYLTKKNILNK